MKPIILAVATLAAMSGALAQTPPTANAPGNNAVNTSGANNSSRPVTGANSFTEGQAKSRIEAAGYTAITGLTKDANGIWRGTARKDGSSAAVSVDFQGNVNSN